jgi:hypothetical protein
MLIVGGSVLLATLGEMTIQQGNYALAETYLQERLSTPAGPGKSGHF